jgi:hypothetical protein
MKRIILFVLLFAAIKVAGQTTGYLRFDTVRIMKQGGTCELYIINKTKDSLGLLTNVGGGLTRFIKPKVLNDSTLIIGLDTVVVKGSGSAGRFGLEDVTATGARAFNANNNTFKIDSFSNYTLKSKINPTGVDRGMWGTFELRNSYAALYNYHSNGISTRSYGFLANSTLAQMSAVGHNPARAGFVQADTVQVILEHDPNRFYIFSDSAALINMNGGTMDFRIRTLPETIDTTQWKPVAIGPLGQLKKVPGWPGGGGGGTPGGSDTQIQYNSSGSFAGDGGLTYHAVNNRVTTDSIEAKTLRQDSGFYRRLAPFLKPDTAYLIGNSHTVGSGASVTDSGYAYRESATLGVVPVNVAIAGTGAVSQANRFLINKNPDNSTMAIAMIGFNDPRRNAGLPRKTLNKIINAHKAVFANQYLKSFTNAGTGGVGVTRTGSWPGPSWDAQGEGGKTTVGCYTNNTGDYIEYDFADSTVIVGLMGGDGSGASYTGTDIEVKIDGVVVNTINTNDQTDGISDASGLDNKRCAMSFMYTGLTNASHTIRLTKLSTGGGGYMICDYFGHLEARQTAQLMLWHHIPKMDATGYATSPAGATDATTDTVNAKIDSLKTTYPISLYPTYVVPSNTVYDVATDINADHIHMADPGHRKIADLATGSVLNSVMPAPAQPGAMYYTNEFRGITDDGTSKTFLMREDGDSRYIMNNNIFNQAANFKITGNGNARKFVTDGGILGDSITAAERQLNGVTAGTVAGSTLPFMNWRNNSASTDNKTYDVIVGTGTLDYRLTSDNLSSATSWLSVTRSGITPLRILLPTIEIDGLSQMDGEVHIGGGADAGTHTLQNTGGFYQNGLVSLNLGSDATGDIHYRNGSGNLARIGIGTAGQALVVNSGATAPEYQTLLLKGTKNWTPGIVSAGSSTSTTVTVTGAAVGDPVTICKLAAYSNGEIYDAFVSATNTVTIRVHNVSTGSANYSSASDYNVVVLKY